MSTEAALKDILSEVLSLGDKVKRFNASTPLLGALPELDSMAVVSLITTIEEHFGIVIGDDEVNAETFQTLGSLTTFVDEKSAASSASR